LLTHQDHPIYEKHETKFPKTERFGCICETCLGYKVVGCNFLKKQTEMTIRNLFYLAILFSAIRLAIWLLMPYLIIEYNISPFKLGLILGTIKFFFWIVILWLIFKVFTTTELKSYMKLLIPLVILIIAITKSNEIGRIISENLKADEKLEEVKKITPDEFNKTNSNKVYISSDYEDETIDPKTYYASGKVYNIFIYNETGNPIVANKNITIKPKESFIFKISDTTGIALDNGIQFFFGETEGLEVIDKKIQVSGLGGEWLNKLNVPESTDFAFSILNPGKGDPIPKE